MIRRWLAALALLALVATALAGVAHASELALTRPTTPSVHVAHKCAQPDVQVTGVVGKDQLTVAGLPAACGGLPLRLWLREDGTTHRVDAVAPRRGGTLTVTMAVPAGPQTAALATVDTWPMPTTTRIVDVPSFTCRTYEKPEIGCTVTVTDRNAEPWRGFWQRTIQISTTSRAPVRWEVTMDLSTFATEVTRQLLDQQRNLTLMDSPRVDCSRTPRTVTVRGIAGQNDHVSSTTPRAAQLQGSTTVNPDLYPVGVLFTCP